MAKIDGQKERPVFRYEVALTVNVPVLNALLPILERIEAKLNTLGTSEADLARIAAATKDLAEDTARAKAALAAQPTPTTA